MLSLCRLKSQPTNLCQYTRIRQVMTPPTNSSSAVINLLMSSYRTTDFRNRPHHTAQAQAPAFPERFMQTDGIIGEGRYRLHVGNPC